MRRSVLAKMFEQGAFLFSLLGFILALAALLVVLWEHYVTAGVLGGVAIGVFLAALFIWLQPLLQPAVVDGIRAFDCDKEERAFGVELLTHNADGSRGDEIVELSWKLFQRNANRLCRYVAYHRSIEIAACIGINPVGILLANYVASRRGLERRHMGAIPTTGRGSGPSKSARWMSFALPRDSEVRHEGELRGKVLLVDSQVQTGGSIQQVYEKLTSRPPDDKGCKEDHIRCNEDDIWYVALVASGIDAKLIEDVRARSGKLQLKDLLDGRDVAWAPTQYSSPVPARVFCFTPDKMRMPDGLY